MRTGPLALGVVLVVLGSVFTLQGLGHLAGSPMTGVTLWAVLGPVIAVAGIVLVIATARRGSGRPRP